jgi:hypothetical protein
MMPLSPVADGQSRRMRGNGSGMRGSIGRTPDTAGNLPGAPWTDGEDWDAASDEIERRHRGGCFGRSERGREGEEEGKDREVRERERKGGRGSYPLVGG